jgi:hypothetical protein
MFLFLIDKKRRRLEKNVYDYCHRPLRVLSGASNDAVLILFQSNIETIANIYTNIVWLRNWGSDIAQVRDSLKKELLEHFHLDMELVVENGTTETFNALSYAIRLALYERYFNYCNTNRLDLALEAVKCNNDLIEAMNTIKTQITGVRSVRKVSLPNIPYFLNMKE